jgi:regulator of cell morphogenesis and NO signaling
MTEDPTLASLVTANPAAARVLERHGLDYCCGGAQRLRDACAARGIDPDQVVAELVAEPEVPAPEWGAMDPAELVDHIVATHHAYLDGELPRLQALATKVAGVHGDRHPELVRVAELVEALRADLEPHLAKEEQVLFPMIRELAGAATRPAFHCGTLQAPIRVMLAEHDRTGELLAQLRTLTDGFTPPADACASYTALYEGLAALEADVHLHVHKESNVLFPPVLALETDLRR